MSFKVGILQKPVDMEPKVITTELSGDDLQAKLSRDMRNVISINGGNVTVPQKMVLHKIGQGRPVSGVEHRGDDLYVTARFSGRLATWAIRPDGSGHWVGKAVSILPSRAYQPRGT